MQNTRQLLKILQNQLATCERYLELENQKTQVLVTGDIKTLDNIVKEEQVFVMKMDSFENKRQMLLEEIGLGDATINELINDHIDELVDEFNLAYEGLSSTTSKLIKVNSLNQKLLKQRLLVVNNVMANIANEEVMQKVDFKDDSNIIYKTDQAIDRKV